MRKLIFITALFLTSCGLAEKKKVVGDYYLVAADTGEQMSLTYHTSEDGSDYGTIVEACVFAAGCNDKYIILKRHPYNFHINKNVTLYYIVPVENYYRPNNTSLNEFQFNKKRKELGIEDIQFTIVYKDLE